MAEIAQTMSIITAKALNAMRTCDPRKPAIASPLSEERTSRVLPFGNNATRSAIILEGMASAVAPGRASISSVNRAAAASLGISARLVASPGIDIEPGERGKDAEPCSVSIFAKGRAEELVELRSDEWRQGGVSHITTP